MPRSGPSAQEQLRQQAVEDDQRRKAFEDAWQEKVIEARRVRTEVLKALHETGLSNDELATVLGLDQETIADVGCVWETTVPALVVDALKSKLGIVIELPEQDARPALDALYEDDPSAGCELSGCSAFAPPDAQVLDAVQDRSPSL